MFRSTVCIIVVFAVMQASGALIRRPIGNPSLLNLGSPNLSLINLQTPCGLPVVDTQAVANIIVEPCGCGFSPCDCGCKCGCGSTPCDCGSRCNCGSTPCSCATGTCLTPISTSVPVSPCSCGSGLPLAACECGSPLAYAPCACGAPLGVSCGCGTAMGVPSCACGASLPSPSCGCGLTSPLLPPLPPVIGCPKYLRQVCVQPPFL